MAADRNDMKAWLVQKNAENSLLLRVNMVELRGSARSQAFAIGRDDTFGMLREKIALKVGRPDEACFISATVRVAYRFGNLSATSSATVDPWSRTPHDHECVHATLEALRLQHHGAEVTVVARDRSMYGRVTLHDDDDEEPNAGEAGGIGNQNEPILDVRNSVANAGDDFNGSTEYATVSARQGALEVLTRDCGGELPTNADGEAPASPSSSSSAASHSATSQVGDAPSEHSFGSGSSGNGSAYVGGGAAAARALFADALSRSILGATVLLSAPPDEDLGGVGSKSSSSSSRKGSSRSTGSGWSFLKGNFWGGSSAEPGARMAPHAAWCMTDGNTLWFAPNPQGLAVAGQGHASQAAGEQQLRDHEEQRAAARRRVNHMVGTSASARSAALHALPASHPAGHAAWRFNEVPRYRSNGGGLDCGCLRAIELDRFTEIRVTYAGAVLMDRRHKSARDSESLAAGRSRGTSMSGNRAAASISSGGYPPPPKSQGYTLQIVSHAGARAGVEPRVYSQRCASLRAAASIGASPTSANRALGNSSNGGPFAVPARLGGGTGNSNNSNGAGGNPNSPDGGGGGSGRVRAGSAASSSGDSVDSGLVVLTIELGPEATALDLGDWVKALTAGRATTKFQHTTEEFSRPLPPRPPPQAVNLYGVSSAGSEGTSAASSLLPVGRERGNNIADGGSSSGGGGLSGGCDDLMAACDAAIACSAKHESVSDAAIVAEASLGLPGTLRHQPLRSAFKRKLSSAVRDENLLFWAHARDYAHGFVRRSQHLPSTSANGGSNGHSSKETARRAAATAAVAAGGAVGLDDLIDGTIVEDEEWLDGDESTNAAPSTNGQPSLLDDAAFEAAAALVCSETCALYLDPSGERRVSGLAKGPDEIELRRVLRVSAEYQLALQAEKVSAIKKNGASSGSSSAGLIAQTAASSSSSSADRGAQREVPRTCGACTFLNEDHTATACSMCDAPLPPRATLPLKPPPPLGRSGSGAQSSTGTGFGRGNPQAGMLFAELAAALLRSMEEAGEDWAEFSALGNPLYRKLLRAVPAHARAARRGQSNPLAPRVPPSIDKARRLGDAGEVPTPAERPPFGWWFSSAGDNAVDAAATNNDDHGNDDDRGSNADTLGPLRSGGLGGFSQSLRDSSGSPGLRGVKGSSSLSSSSPRLGKRAQSALQLNPSGPRSARAVSTDEPKRPGLARSMSNRLFGSAGNYKAARFEQAMKAEADAIEAQLALKRKADERRAAAAPTLAQLEERWRLSFSNGSTAASPASSESSKSSGAQASLFYATCPGSVGDFHSAQPSVALRLRAGFLGDPNTWPEDCAGPHALAMLEGNAKLAHAASAAQEPPSSEAAARVERWWAAAVDDVALQGACRRVSASWAGGVLPRWLPCLLLGESAKGVAAGGGWGDAEVRTAIARRYFESDAKRRHTQLQAAWKTALVTTTTTASASGGHNGSGGGMQQQAWVRCPEPPCAVSGGEASAAAGSWPWALGGPLHPLVSNALELPGTPLLWAPCRAVWRPKSNEWAASLSWHQQQDTRLSSFNSGNGGTSSGPDAESWASSERLNNWSAFTAVAACYLMVLVEVAESAPLAVAAAHAGFPHVAADASNNNGGKSSNNNSSSSSSGKVALLCFLREGSGVVERVVHIRDLCWIAPAVKPLHALALGDALGECGLVLLNEGLGFSPGNSNSGSGASSSGASAAGSGSSGTSSHHGDNGGGVGGSSNSSGTANGSVRDALLACAARDVWLQALAKAGGARQPASLNRSPASTNGSLRESAASSSSNGSSNGAAHSTGPLVRPSLYEGVVRKKGGGALVRWQSRHFTLDASASMMRYYDDTTGEAKGNIPVETIEYVTPGTDCYFTIVSRPGEVKKTNSKDKATRVWDLQAATRAEMFDWVSALEHGLSLRRAMQKAQQAISSQATTASTTIASGGAGRAAQGRGGPARPGGGGRSTAN